MFGSSLRKSLREPETFSLRHPFHLGLYTKYWNRMAYIYIQCHTIKKKKKLGQWRPPGNSKKTTECYCGQLKSGGVPIVEYTVTDGLSPLWQGACVRPREFKALFNESGCIQSQFMSGIGYELCVRMTPSPRLTSHSGRNRGWRNELRLLLHSNSYSNVDFYRESATVSTVLLTIVF